MHDYHLVTPERAVVMTEKEIADRRFIDYSTLGKFLGLAESAEALRSSLGDKNFVDHLIKIGESYRSRTAPKEPTAGEVFRFMHPAVSDEYDGDEA